MAIKINNQEALKGTETRAKATSHLALHDLHRTHQSHGYRTSKIKVRPEEQNHPEK